MNRIIERLRALIEELKISPEALFEQPVIAKTVFDASLDAMIIVDTRGTIKLLNDLAEEMFGYEKHELLGQNVSVLVPRERRAAHESQMELYFDYPVAKRLRPGLTGVRKDGTVIPVMIALNPIVSDIGMLTLATIRRVKDDDRDA